MKQAVLQNTTTKCGEEPTDWRAFDEVEEAVERLYAVVWDRWHPEHADTRGQAPKIVYDALDDLRPLVLEIEGLWEHLGRVMGRRS